MSAFLRGKPFLLCLLVLFLLAGLPLPAAAYTSYGNYFGTTVDFVNVNETSSTDSEPLFGSPTVVGDRLLFFPTRFASSSSGVGADTTSSTFQIMLTAKAGSKIDRVRIQEFGDYTLTGSGTGTMAQMSGYLTVTDLASGTGGVKTDFDNAIFTASPSSGPFSGFWEIDFTGNALPVTLAMLSFNNNLQTSSESNTAAFIQKKVVNGPAIDLSINPTPVPLPGALWLLASGLVASVTVFRKKILN
jgi:hypothetical protein